MFKIDEQVQHILREILLYQVVETVQIVKAISFSY